MTPKLLLEKLREAAKILDKQHVTREEFFATTGIAEWPVYDHFRTWNDFHVAAGLEPDRIMQKKIALWQQRLEATFSSPDKVVGKRLLELGYSENEYADGLIIGYPGFVFLMDSFLDFYIESIQCRAATYTAEWPIDKNIIFRFHVANFRRFRASYYLLIKGYVVEGLSLLRTVLENVLQFSALWWEVITVHEVFGGITTDTASGMTEEEMTRRIRNNSFRTDKSINDFFFGAKSDMSESAISAWNLIRFFLNNAVHKARLTVWRQSMIQTDGSFGIAIFPETDQQMASLYMNFAKFIAWPNLRTLYILQIQANEFGEEWNQRYTVLDESFEQALKLNPNELGRAVEEMVQKKFQFVS